jgi:hypothetical protein
MHREFIEKRKFMRVCWLSRRWKFGLKEGACVVVVGEVAEEDTKLLGKEAGGNGVGVFDGCDSDAFSFF